MHAEDSARPPLQTPALSDVLSLLPEGEALPGYSARPSSGGASRDCACARDSAFARAAGAWMSGTRRSALSSEDELFWSRATDPGLLSRNRRRARKERVEHDEAGGLLEAETGADTVWEGRCGRGRGGGGR